MTRGEKTQRAEAVVFVRSTTDMVGHAALFC